MMSSDAHFVEMKIDGTMFAKKERMCIYRTEDDPNELSSDNRFQGHPLYICEELEISDHLLNILEKRNLVPRDITRKLRVKVNRRDKIHELLRHYDISKDE
ncbi:hypothetical protein MAR_002860, partial [Mya arenaria]